MIGMSVLLRQPDVFSSLLTELLVWKMVAERRIQKEDVQLPLKLNKHKTRCYCERIKAFVVQETHALLSIQSSLLSLEVVSSSFVVIPVSLNGSRRISRSSSDGEILKNGSLLNIFATCEKHVKTIPDIMLLNFIDFASNYKVAKKRLTCQLDNIIPRAFPVILDCHSAGRSIMVLHQTR